MTQKKPQIDLKNMSSCTCFNLRKTTRVITQYYDHSMKSLGLRGTQFTILAAVSEAQSITISHLADFLMMDRTTLTRNLKPLEKQDLLQIIPGADQRTRELSLTKKGHKTFLTAKPLWERTQTEIIDKLGEAKLKKLLFMLNETIAITK